MKKKPQPTPVPKMGEVVRPKHHRNDGWQNLVTLLGTSADKRTKNQLTWDLHPPEFYEQVYAGGGIPARIVDVVPEHALRNWVNWMNLEGLSKRERQFKRDAIEERCLEFDLRGNFLKAWKWGRAFGGGLLHIVTDTNDPGSPLRRGEKVLALRDLSRWDVRILTTDVEYDFGSPNYGHPRTYYLNVQMGSQYKGYPIHWSRMVRFDGQLVPRRTFIRNNYWHDSILNRIYNSIRNYEGANDSVASMLHDFNIDIYKLKNVANMIASGKEQQVKNRIEMMNYTKSVINAMILDADLEDFENKAKSVEGVADLLTLQASRLVADTEIPHTILLGESPDGSNATGNSTNQNWINFLKAEQEHVAKPKLNRLVDIMFPDEDKLRPKFRPLRVLDEQEMADVKLKIAQSDDIYLTQQVLDPTEIAESRFGGDEYSTDTELDEEGREAGTVGPGSGNYAVDPDDGDDGASGFGSSNEGEETEEQEKGKKKARKAQPKSAKEKKKDAHDLAEPEDYDQSQSVDAVQSEFEPRNTELAMGKVDPKTKPIVSQTESLPMRDPKNDPRMKGPGIPNKSRTFLPTRGNGVTAQSGFDPVKDAGSKGVQREGGTQAGVLEQSQKGDEDVATKLGKAYAAEMDRLGDVLADEESAPTRASQILVRDGDKFLMGKRKDNGRWAFPGGHVEKGESHHQGAIRELSEETGLVSKRLKFLGARMVEPEQGKRVHLNMYEHHIDEDAKPNPKNDPDKEFSSFRWLSSKEALPEDVSGNLAHPNNVVLQHMGLLK